jgi:VanZ family protein
MRSSKLNNPRLWSLLLTVCWLTLFVLTHLPALGPLSPSTRFDEFVHGLAFAVLAFVLATTWRLNAGELSLAQLGWAWLVLLMYAALDEWTQQFVGRSTSITDWWSDITGAMVGLVLYAVSRRWYQRRFG